jgi:outer membrane lipoprotein carrier protein
VKHVQLQVSSFELSLAFQRSISARLFNHSGAINVYGEYKMNRFRRLLAFIAIVMLSLAAPGYGADLTEVIATLEQGYKLLSDLQADFSQRTIIASMKREERGNGELFIKKPAASPAMFRFNYTKPRQQIVSDGKTVWYYLPDNKQVMVSDVAALFEGGSGIALNYLTGMGQVSKDFTISFSGAGRDQKGNYLLELVPKKPSQVMTKLQLTIASSAVEQFRESGTAKAPFPILSSVVHDPFGNRTIIEFSRVKVNQGISNDRFSFKIPKGVEVIKTK